MSFKGGYIARLCASCVAILALAGCAPLDMLRVPQGAAVTDVPHAIDMPASWPETLLASDGLASAPATSQTQVHWWRHLGDAQLDGLIEAALITAPDLRSARARLRQSRAGRDLAVAGLYPSLDASLAVNRARSGNASPQTFYAAGFDAGWEPSVFGGQRDAVAGAEADFAATAALFEAAHASLAAEVALNYVNLRTFQRRLAIARENVRSQAETLQLVEWRTTAGLASLLDVEQARANLESSRATLPGLDSGAAATAHHLAVLTGLAPGGLREMLAVATPLPNPPEHIAVGIPADTLRQRPDVRAAEFVLRAELARTAQREADRYPSLRLSGSLGWQAASTAALGRGGSAAQALAASLAMTLFDGGRIRARIEVQDAVREQALVAYEKSILGALEDVENALADYAAGRARVAARRKAATAAGNAARLAQNLYAAGSIDFQKVLDSERTRLSAEDGLASAEADVLTAVIRLYKALGGGWQIEGSETDKTQTEKSS